MDLLKGGLELRFHPDERDYPTWPDEEDRSKFECPCFVNRGHHVFADKLKYRCIGYQFYYTQNKAIGPFRRLFPKSRLFGYHRHDVEAIYILFDRETKEPRHVYYKAHGLGQGVWALWEECEKTEDGALVVYVALNSHASYPKPGRVVRISGFGSDYASGKGRRMRIGKDNAAKMAFRDFGSGIRIHDKIPRISNNSITDRQRRFLLHHRGEIRRRANAQYEDTDSEDGNGQQ